MQFNCAIHIDYISRAQNYVAIRLRNESDNTDLRD